MSEEATAHKTLDYRRCAWGHNHTLRQTEPGHLSGFVWYYRSVKEGDHVIWNTAYGVAEGVITEVKPSYDPADMYHVEVDVVERRAYDGTVLTEPPA